MWSYCLEYVTVETHIQRRRSLSSLCASKKIRASSAHIGLENHGEESEWKLQNWQVIHLLKLLIGHN